MKRREFIGAAVGAAAMVKLGAVDSLLADEAPLPCGTGVDVSKYYPRYFDRQGRPMEMMEWARKIGDRVYARVALTHLPNYRYVSTVWLGLDHGFRWTGKPQAIFETMAFREELSYSHPLAYGGTKMRGFLYHEEVDCERWGTESEALSGHRAMCEKICPGSLTLGG